MSTVNEPMIGDRHGLQVLSAGETALLRSLDSVFEGWGIEVGAASMIMPALLPVESLARLDFYENFPHHALVVSPLDLDRRGGGYGSAVPAFSTGQLCSAELGLPSAACFAVYLHHEGQQLPGNTTVTVLGRCFRREEYYDGLRRVLGFHMREVVALGSSDFVQAHLQRFSDRITAFTDALELPVRKEAATDPFYDRGGQRALLQKLAPVKHEFLVGDLAIASVNVHRNFFGERCSISLADTGTPVFTSCVAFGLERWLSVLRERFGDWPAALEAVGQAAVDLPPLGTL
jgi:seryl-tRNA synthetase